jgi:hypothetical protein
MRALCSSRLGVGVARATALPVAATALLAAAAVLLVAPAGRAQLRWDVGAEAGVQSRGTFESGAGAPGRGVGPVFELQGHVALIPMVRIGAYVSYDITPDPPIGTRSFTGGGLHLRVSPPLLPAPWRTWVFAGLGAAYAYAASYHQVVTLGTQSVDAVFSGASGGMLEVPLGLGLGYRLRGLAAPWMVFTELGGRLGVWYWGPLYGEAPYAVATGAGRYGPSPGKDSFALSLSVGLSLEP